MRGTRALLAGALCAAAAACSGGEGNNQSNATGNDAASPSFEWVPGGEGCPVELSNWSVTITQQTGQVRAAMHVEGSVRSTDAGLMAGALSPVPSGRHNTTEQHFEIGPLVQYPQPYQAEQRFFDGQAPPGLNAVVIDCNGKEVLRITRFTRKTPGQP